MTNLIEQLGGYEKSKECLNTKTARLSVINELRAALLEHRRQHNIFEKDDFIVFDVNNPFCAKMQPDLMQIINQKYQEHDMIAMIDNQVYVVGGKAVRHATDKEIAQGYRDE